MNSLAPEPTPPRCRLRFDAQQVSQPQPRRAQHPDGRLAGPLGTRRGQRVWPQAGSSPPPLAQRQVELTEVEQAQLYDNC